MIIFFYLHYTSTARYCITMGLLRSFLFFSFVCLFVCLWSIGSVGDCESATLCWQVDRALLIEKNWVGKAQDDGLVLTTNDTPLEEIKAYKTLYLYISPHWTLHFVIWSESGLNWLELECCPAWFIIRLVSRLKYEFNMSWSHQTNRLTSLWP